MEKKIISVIKYFSFFAYHPTSEEIYTFLQAKISKNSFDIELDRMVKQKLIVNCNKYTPPQYSIKKVKIKKLRVKISDKKIRNWRFRAYVKLISLFPQIRLVGLSGSISMMNAGESDDIDLFIITAKRRLFTGRLIALILAQLLGLRRNREARSLNFLSPVGTLPAGSGESQVAKNFNSLLSRNKVCLNLFFDESNLKVPKFKQTEFVGHEVLQMKPIIIKGDVYQKFLEANVWVFKLFPNASHVIPAEAGIQIKSTGSPTGSGMTELILKKFQLRLINKHKTSEIITTTQLWFHPNDYNSFM